MPNLSEQIDDADVAELLKVGAKHHQDGRIAEAEACYRKVLVAQPNHPDALHQLGVVINQAGRHDLAVELIRLALQLNGRNYSTLPALVEYCAIRASMRKQ
jgi:Flp pilus assembly protein TadD